MREGWKEDEFGSLLDISLRNGINRPSRDRGKGYKMINMGELFANDRLYDIDMELVLLNEKEKENFQVRKYDLLFARQSIVAEGAGKCSIVLEVDEMACFESHIIRARLNNENNALYFYYLFQSDYGKALLSTIRQQGVQAGIRGSDLQKLKLQIPTLETQRKIASILSGYDDLIDNNLKRIKILEETAQQTYEEWFVRMRFPGYETAVMNEITGLPEGWGKKVIGDLADVKGGKRLPEGHNLTDIKTKHPYIRVRDLSNGTVDLTGLVYLNEETHFLIKRYVISKDDIFISIAGTVGLVGIIPPIISHANLTENCAKITNLKYTLLQDYICLFLQSKKGQYYIESRTGGASQPKLALNRITSIPFILPSGNILELFSIKIERIRFIINNLQSQNQRLRESRDLLLPRLMMGMIEV